MLRGLLRVVRAMCWATVLAAVITAVLVWRSSPESWMTWRVALTFFGIIWAACFVPALAAELLTAHLALELGDEGNPLRRAAAKESTPRATSPRRLTRSRK